MNVSPVIAEVALECFYTQLEQSISQASHSQHSQQFEKLIGREAEELMSSMGKSGWDYQIVCPFFEDRGASILIQNTQLDWHSVLLWLNNRCAGMPVGSIINFEVYDSIQGTTMVGGRLVQRCIFTASGSFMHR